MFIDTQLEGENFWNEKDREREREKRRLETFRNVME